MSIRLRPSLTTISYSLSTEFPQPATYYSTVPQVPDRTGQPRRYDVSNLRETKKRLEMAAGQGPAMFDEITVDLLEDCVDLASDRSSYTIMTSKPRDES